MLLRLGLSGVRVFHYLVSRCTDFSLRANHRELRAKLLKHPELSIFPEPPFSSRAFHFVMSKYISSPSYRWRCLGVRRGAVRISRAPPETHAKRKKRSPEITSAQGISHFKALQYTHLPTGGEMSGGFLGSRP